MVVSLQANNTTTKPLNKNNMKILKVCDCKDKECKRQVIETYEGKTYVKNMFSCGKFKKLKINKQD